MCDTSGFKISKTTIIKMSFPEKKLTPCRKAIPNVRVNMPTASIFVDTRMRG